jgi:hypothetical protein
MEVVSHRSVALVAEMVARQSPSAGLYPVEPGGDGTEVVTSGELFPLEMSVQTDNPSRPSGDGFTGWSASDRTKAIRVSVLKARNSFWSSTPLIFRGSDPPSPSAESGNGIPSSCRALNSSLSTVAAVAFITKNGRHPSAIVMEVSIRLHDFSTICTKAFCRSSGCVRGEGEDSDRANICTVPEQSAKIALTLISKMERKVPDAVSTVGLDLRP